MKRMGQTMATKKLTRDKAISDLAQDEYDKLDDGNIIDILIEGCSGWGKKTTEEIVEAYLESLGEEIEIVEGDEQ
jgi:adenylylsulfate kinase-like enzyme